MLEVFLCYILVIIKKHSNAGESCGKCNETFPRRDFLRYFGIGWLSLTAKDIRASELDIELINRPIPSSDEVIPAVIRVIPGIGNPEHVRDNLQAGNGLLPDESARKLMGLYFQRFNNLQDVS